MAALGTVNAIACVQPIRFGPTSLDRGWTAYLGSPAHDRSASEQLSADPRPDWRADAGRAVRGAPAFGDSIMALGVAERVVVLLDRSTGEVIWRQRLGGTIHGGPLIHGDRLFVATEEAPDGLVYALRLKDGRTIWSYSAGSVLAPLAFDGDGVYGATERGGVFRLDPGTGKPVWRSQVMGPIQAAPIPTPHGIVVATTRDTLYLLDRASGTVQHRLKTPGTVLATPALGAGSLFVATSDGQVLEVSLPDLHVTWNESVGDAVYGAPALVGDTLFVMARNGRLTLFPIACPGAALVHDLDVISIAGPTPTASGILVGTVGGEVLLVDAGSGQIAWRAQVTGPVEQPPLVVDRQLVVVGGRGDIHAYR